MTDITKIFRAFIKAKQVSIDANLGLNNKRLKKNEKNSTGFLSRAKLILNDIIKLKYSLLEARTSYLSPFYLLSPTNKIMNDEQRLNFELYIEKQIKQCRDGLEELKSSIGKIFQGQRRSHYELVCAYLERVLVECTKIYSELKCLRYKRETERKKIGRLDNDDQRALLNFESNHNNNNHRRKSDDLTENIRSSPTTETKPSNITIVNHYFDQDTEEENPIASPQPTGTELRQLQQENEQLYEEVARRSEEIFAISTQVIEISQLQKDIFDNIIEQNVHIETIDTSAVSSNDDLAAAIIHIRDAIRNTAQMRRWVIFFLLVMIFSLLFLDWYNV